MGRLKQSLSEDAMDALEDVQDGLITWEQYVAEYDPYGLTEPQHGSVLEHDCHLSPEDGCPAHWAQK